MICCLGYNKPMSVHLPRIYISAAHKSSGKTTLSIGLCRALFQRGLKVQAFKKGPDYIDPLWLSRASGLSGEQGCHNLDFNTQTPDEILDTLVTNGGQADISIIEGNKGLYDGVALNGSDSNAAMARLTRTPVILVIDTRGVTRGVAPLLLGYQQFDPEINIAGVIFNLSSGGRHEAKLRAVTEQYTDIPVLGVVRKSPQLVLDERHLGLMPSNETKNAEKKINDIAAQVSDQVDLDAILAASKQAHPLSVKKQGGANKKPCGEQKARVRIGVCEDSAFGFYYVGDKQALREAGAELVTINTLKDACLPEIDGLFIGGGFPETHMQSLSANASMRNSIREAIEAGLPTYAECGGLMYLAQSLQWNEQNAEMVGIIPGKVVMHQRPQGRGHVELLETDNMPWPDVKSGATAENGFENNENACVIKAHEFHYSSLESPGSPQAEAIAKKGRFAYQVLRGVGITGAHDGWVYKNLLASYAHMRDTEQFHWARRFVEFVRTCQAG